MKIYNPRGSKERLVEMFQQVNKVKLSEDFATSNSSIDVVENAFNQLINNQLKIQNTNNQSNDNESYVELNCIDGSGNKVNFKFRVTSSQGSEDVYNVENAELIEFTQIKPDNTTFEVDETMLKQFNSEHKDQILEIVSNYVDFDEGEPEVDELYEDAIKLIDKVPFNVGNERLQKHKAYTDEKPVNPDLRVNSPELNKYVNEEDEIENDPLAMPTDYSDDQLKGLKKNKYTDVDKSYMGTLGDEDKEEATPEEQALFSQAFENLMKRNKTSKNPNYFPVRPEIDKEVKRLQSLNKQEPQDPDVRMAAGKKRVYPAWVDSYLQEEKPANIDKNSIIKAAAEALDNRLGADKSKLSKEEYLQKVKELANIVYSRYSTESVNESEYPSSMEIPKVIEPKTNYPKEQKKRHKVKKLKVNEVDEITPEENPEVSPSQPEVDNVEKLAQDREEQGDQIEGGLGDDKSPLDFDKEQIKLGMKVEMEHTDDPMVALDITLDHLTEDPEYYTVKDDPEASAQANASADASGEEPHKHPLADILNSDGGEEDLTKNYTGEKGVNRAIQNDDKDLTDELLGYKPKNVGDMDEEIVGSNGAESVVGGQSSTSNTDDGYSKYQEYEKKDFNTLPDNEKEEYFNLWTKYKKNR